MDMRCMDTQKVNKACKFIMIGSVAGHQRMRSLKDVLKLMNVISDGMTSQQPPGRDLLMHSCVRPCINF